MKQGTSPGRGSGGGTLSHGPQLPGPDGGTPVAPAAAARIRLPLTCLVLGIAASLGHSPI